MNLLIYSGACLDLLSVTAYMDSYESHPESSLSGFAKI